MLSAIEIDTDKCSATVNENGPKSQRANLQRNENQIQFSLRVWVVFLSSFAIPRTNMRTIELGVSTLECSRLAYGCWRVAGSWDPAEVTGETRAAGRNAILAAYEA